MYDRSAEIGIDLTALMDMTWPEWLFVDKGYEIRQQKQLDMFRNLIATLFNSSGFAKRKVNPKQVMRLPLIDNITGSVKDVNRVPNEFIDRALRLLNKN